MWARIYLIPLLQAEEDRDQVRRHWADKAREKELLGGESKVYNSDRWVFLRTCTRRSTFQDTILLFHPDGRFHLGRRANRCCADSCDPLSLLPLHYQSRAYYHGHKEQRRFLGSFLYTLTAATKTDIYRTFHFHSFDTITLCYASNKQVLNENPWKHENHMQCNKASVVYVPTALSQTRARTVPRLYPLYAPKLLGHVPFLVLARRQS